MEQLKVYVLLSMIANVMFPFSLCIDSLSYDVNE